MTAVENKTDNNLLQNSNVTKKRNGAFDILKFAFSIMILLHHSYILDGIGTKYSIFLRGVTGIDFFFMVSGFFMGASIMRQKNETDLSHLGTDTIQFMKKRVTSVLPVFVFSFFVTLIVKYAVYGVAFTGVNGKIFNSVWELLFLNMAGFPKFKVNNVTWYLSAMYISMLIIYPIIRKNVDLHTKITAPLVGVLIYGWLNKQYNSLGKPASLWVGFAYKGTLRAMAGILIGIGVYSLCCYLKERKVKKSTSIILSVFELTGYVFVFVATVDNRCGVSDFLFLLIYAACITITGSTKSIVTSKINSNRGTMFLGKFSMILFLTHYPWTVLTPVILKNASPVVTIVCYALFSVVWALFVYLIFEVLVKKRKKKSDG